MTKKHFIALAKALADTKPTAPRLTDTSEHVQRCAEWAGQWRACVNSVANVCASTNPRFDRARFLAACGMGGQA